jgi:sarcosine oxidase
VAAEVVDVAGERHPALREDAGQLLWDPHGGAIRAALAIAWLRGELGSRVRRCEVRSLDEVSAGHVVLCAGAGTERLWPGVTMRREVHLRMTFAAPAGASYATWADRSERFGATSYGVADGPGRFALGLADHADQPAPADPAADVVPADVNLDAQRARVRDYAAAAFPGLGEPIDEVVRLLTILPGPDEDAYVLHTEPRLTVVAGHNLFKLAPLLAERAAESALDERGPDRAALQP